MSRKGNFYITGEEIKKTGETTYVIKRGEFTTCGWDRPAWKFSAKDVKVTMQGYATASHATFRILGSARVLFSLGHVSSQDREAVGFPFARTYPVQFRWCQAPRLLFLGNFPGSGCNHLAPVDSGQRPQAGGGVSLRPIGIIQRRLVRNHY